MKRLMPYLKPYFVLILLAILLLFGQANCDLALPDYMSRIVNIGIQQGGIEDAAPEALRATTMAALQRFVDAAAAERLAAAYTLVEPGDDAADYLVRYPLATTEAIYVRSRLSAAERAALAADLAPAWLAARPAARMSPAAAVKAELLALGMDEFAIQRRYLLATGAMMLILTLLGAAATILVGFIAAKVAAGFARDVRLAVFRQVENFSSREFDTFSTASLITRTTNDVTQLQMVIMSLIRMVFYAPIIGVGGIIRAIGKDSSMWWIIAVAVAILCAIVVFVFRLAVPKFTIMQKLVDRLNLVSRENLSGMMVIRAFNRQPREEERFDQANRELTANMLFINRVMVSMMPLMMLIMNAFSLLIVWVGAGQIERSAMQVGDMMAFMQYAMQIFFSFLMMSMMFIMLPRAAVSAERVAAVLGTEPAIRDPEQPTKFSDDFRATVEFKDVRFRYPGAQEDVLHDISFIAEPGQTTAIIGATGSGKTSIVSLVPRFYDVTAGSVLIGGIDVREVGQRELRDKIGYIPQKAVLFSGTIESNLRYADENAAAEAVQAAIRIAQAQEIVDSGSEGLASPIAQGGANVSGGQKQRLSIARALVKKPPIYIFDDSFSALDFKTDAALRRALKRETGGSTVIIVTQRVATVIKADRIVVLDDGRIAGIGTHGELMATCAAYREIATSQLSEEELR